MDFAEYYDDYWRKKGDEVDYSRLELIIKRVNSRDKVLEIGGQIGLLAEKIKEKGADVTITDISGVALERARDRGINDAVRVDLDLEPLPFEDNTFDAVVSNSSIEHIFYPEKLVSEGSRVLKPGGNFVLLAPNLAHWRHRLWLLAGRFPYVKDSPTDELHIRFLTIHEAKAMCEKHDLYPIRTEGCPSLWVKGIYPAFFRYKYVRNVYSVLAKKLPSLFARDFILVCRKNK